MTYITRLKDVSRKNMGKSMRLRLGILLVFFLTLGHCQRQNLGENATNHTSTDRRCVWVPDAADLCQGMGDALGLGSNTLVYFNSTSRRCAPLPCVDNDTSLDLLFPDTMSCEDACVKHLPPLGGCQETHLGCCRDGKTPKKTADDNCSGVTEVQPPNQGHNPLALSGNSKIIIGVTTGVVGLGVIVLVVGVSVAWIRYKRRKNEEKRMNDLLKMYANAYEESSSEDEEASDEDPVSLRLL